MRCYVKLSQEGLKMKKSCLFFWILFCFVALSPVYAQWARTYVGDGNEAASSVVALRNQGYLVAGATDSWGEGETDFYVLKVKRNGGFGWQKTYGGNGVDTAWSATETRLKKYVVVGETHSFGQGAADFWILKLNPNGSIVWQKTLGGASDDVALSVTQAMDGGYAVAGYTSSFGKGLKDMWLIKLSRDGELEWQKTFGGKKDDGANCIAATLDGGFIVCGYTESFGRGGRDIMVIKLDDMGEVQWQKALGKKEDEEATCIQQTQDLGFVLCGWSGSLDYASQRMYMAGLTEKGKTAWQRRYFNGDDEIAYSIKQSRNRDFYWVGGETGNGKAFILQFNPLSLVSNQASGRVYGSNLAWDGMRGMDLTSTGGIVIVGASSSWCTWSLDLWMVKTTNSNTLGTLCALHRKESWWWQNPKFKPKKVNALPIPSSSGLLDSNVAPRPAQSRIYNLCQPTCKLTISEGEGGWTIPNEGVYTYPMGEKVQISAVSYSGHQFLKWIGNIESDKRQLEIVMDGDKSIKAVFSGYKRPPGGSGDEWGGGGGGGFINVGGNSNDPNSFNGLVLFVFTLLISLILLSSFYVAARKSV